MAVLYAAVGGHLDGIPVDAVRQFERGFLSFLRERHPGVLAALRAERRLTDAVREGLEEALRQFREGFRA